MPRQKNEVSATLLWSDPFLSVGGGCIARDAMLDSLGSFAFGHSGRRCSRGFRGLFAARLKELKADFLRRSKQFTQQLTQGLIR